MFLHLFNVLFTLTDKDRKVLRIKVIINIFIFDIPIAMILFPSRTFERYYFARFLFLIHY